MSQGRARDRPGVEKEPGVIVVCQLKLELGVFWFCLQKNALGVSWEPELLAGFQRVGIGCWPQQGRLRTAASPLTVTGHLEPPN